jgi:hypothetical protein
MLSGGVTLEGDYQIISNNDGFAPHYPWKGNGVVRRNL